MSGFQRFQPGNYAGAGSKPPMPPIVNQVHAAIDCMEDGGRPAEIGELRWHVLVKDVRRFTNEWLEKALAAGWSLEDLFGSHPDLGSRRVDLAGVATLLNGAAICALDERRILIESGADRHTFYRQAPGASVAFDRSGAVMIWDAVSASRRASQC